MWAQEGEEDDDDDDGFFKGLDDDFDTLLLALMSLPFDAI